MNVEDRRASRPFAACGVLSLVLLLATGSAQGAIPQAERNVLLALYTSTNGESWTDHSGWGGASGTECSWYGIECIGEHVTGIYLDQNNLVGNLPALDGLTELESFYAYNNQLSGEIPELSGISSLRFFQVGSNQLSGSLPSLSGLENLEIFDVQINQLGGTIPPFADLPALRGFGASGNQLVGSLPSLDALGNIESFYVDYNELTGFVPSLANLAHLKRLRINDNQLRGDMPSAPHPETLIAGDSQLCRNYLTPVADANWDAATGESPWYQDCVPLPDQIYVNGFEP